MVVEKSGTRAEIKECSHCLNLRRLQFVSSGRVCRSQEGEGAEAYLREMDEARASRQEELEVFIELTLTKQILIMAQIDFGGLLRML
jgi:hypothetical protein